MRPKWWLPGALLLTAGCVQKETPQSTLQPLRQAQREAAQEVVFQTADGWTIRGDYYSVGRADRAVILLHQRGGSAADWLPLVRSLNQAGIAALALDARGAGRLARPGVSGEAPWETGGDIAGAVAWLKTQGIQPGRIGIAGASYGANNALIYAAKNPGIAAVALLSPGEDYHGLKVAEAARAYKGPILVLTAMGDSGVGKGPEQIKTASGRSIVKLYPGSAHGTALFAQSPESVEAVTQFFAGSIPAAANAA